jgi:hypothetical protein
LRKWSQMISWNQNFSLLGFDTVVKKSDVHLSVGHV